MARPILAAYCIAVTLAPTAIIQALDQSALPPANRVAVASRIHELVQQYFVHWEGAPREDVERAYQDYLTRLAAANDRQAFDLATLRFIAALHNGHTQF